MAVSIEARNGAGPAPAAATHGHRGEVRSTLAITALQMSGKMLGLLKTLVIAAWFGASAPLDAFWVAYTIPAMLPGMVRGVVATAFIPGFMRSAASGENVDWRGLNTLFTLIGILIVLLAAVAVFARHAIVSFMAPGLDAATHDLAAELTALMSIAVLFFGVNAMFAAILQALGRFVVMSLESVITNVVIIAGCVLFAQRYGIRGLTVAVIAGFAVHTVTLAFANRDLLARHLRPAFDIGHADFREPARHMFPLLVGYVGSVGMGIIDRMFVSTLEGGLISVLAYASMIALLPMEVFGQAVMTTFYPSLSREHAAGNMARMQAIHLRGLRLLVFVLLPTAAILVVAAHPVIALLLERGAFSAEATGTTALTLAALALCLPLRAVNYLNFRVFHARQEPWRAVFIGLFGVSLNALLDWLLIGEYGVVGVAFATSAAMAASALLSTLLLERRLESRILRPLASPVFRLALMTLVLVCVTLLVQRAFGALAPDIGRMPAMLLQLVALVPGVAAFLLTGALLGLDEARMTLRALRHGRNALAHGGEKE